MFSHLIAVFQAIRSTHHPASIHIPRQTSYRSTATSDLSVFQLWRVPESCHMDTARRKGGLPLSQLCTVEYSYGGK